MLWINLRKHHLRSVTSPRHQKCAQRGRVGGDPRRPASNPPHSGRRPPAPAPRSLVSPAKNPLAGYVGYLL
ncbi:hypothetical protein EVAR_27687_1 [Eumeta japonica]|uniref:Uncharacterized protein n=1 Tax=Eumeta variegata TaxID=151549 RepID=A0A4C1WRI9_EUMVA|nr:hypothetical protein EVAR_27687_1 [Eumeta japonica]